MIVRRLTEAAKVEAVHAAIGKPFAEIERERAAEAVVEHLPDREVSTAVGIA